MAIRDDIEIKITLRPAQEPSSDPDLMLPGEALKEYPDPNDPRRTSTYIEAVPGREFQIEVILLPSFEMYGADDVLVSFSIDDTTVNMRTVYSMAQIQQDLALGRHRIIRDVYDPFNPMQYCKRSFTFGTLEGGE